LNFFFSTFAGTGRSRSLIRKFWLAFSEGPALLIAHCSPPMVLGGNNTAAACPNQLVDPSISLYESSEPPAIEIVKWNGLISHARPARNCWVWTRPHLSRGCKSARLATAVQHLYSVGSKLPPRPSHPFNDFLYDFARRHSANCTNTPGQSRNDKTLWSSTKSHFGGGAECIQSSPMKSSCSPEILPGPNR